MVNHIARIATSLIHSTLIIQSFGLSIKPPPSISNPTAIFPPLGDSISLFQNVQNLMTALRHSPDPTISTASLLAVYALTAGYETTTNVSSLRSLDVIIRPHTPPHGDTKEFLSIENDPNDYEHWLPPQSQRVRASHPEHPIHWDDINRRMSIYEADALLKHAGYTGTFAKAMVALWMGYPLSWCFGFVDPSVNVRVDIMTREVVEEIAGC